MSVGSALKSFGELFQITNSRHDEYKKKENLQMEDNRLKRLTSTHFYSTSLYRTRTHEPYIHKPLNLISFKRW